KVVSELSRRRRSGFFPSRRVACFVPFYLNLSSRDLPPSKRCFCAARGPRCSISETMQSNATPARFCIWDSKEFEKSLRRKRSSPSRSAPRGAEKKCRTKRGKNSGMTGTSALGQLSTNARQETAKEG